MEESGKQRVNFNLTKETCNQFRRLVPNMSAEVDSFIKKRVGELQGGVPAEDWAESYKTVKARYEALVVKTVKLERTLKTSKRFQEATDLFLELGLKRDLSNVDELIPKFMDAWKGDVSFMHEFLSLVELARDKKTAEQALTEMRRGSDPRPVPPSSGGLPATAPTEQPVRPRGQQPPVEAQVTAIVPFEARPTGLTFDKV